MRLKLSKVVVAILLLAGSVVYGRPQQIDVSMARVQPKVEVKDAGGPKTLSWDRNTASKELPRIIEDNSRYREEARPIVRRKFFFQNNVLHEDYVVNILGNQKTSDKNDEQLCKGASSSDVLVLSRPQDTAQLVNEKLSIKGTNLNNDVKLSIGKATNRIKVDELSERTINSKNNDKVGVKKETRRVIDPKVAMDVELNSQKIGFNVLRLGDESLSDEKNSRNGNETKAGLDMSENSSNVDSNSFLKQNNFTNNPAINVIELLTSLPSQISNSDQSIMQSKERSNFRAEKIRNVVNIKPPDKNLENVYNRHNFDNIQHHLLKRNPDNFETGSNHDGSTLNKNQGSFQRLSDKNNSISLPMRIKTGVKKPLTNLFVKGSNYKTSGQVLSLPIKITKRKPTSSQNAPNPSLKNWPTGAVENDEDLINYEKYTSSYHQVGDSDPHEANDDSGDAEYSHHFNILNNNSDKKPEPTPSILIFEHSFPTLESSEYGEPELVPIYHPKPHENSELSTVENSEQWENISSFSSNHTIVNNQFDSHRYEVTSDNLHPNESLHFVFNENQGMNKHDYVEKTSFEKNLSHAEITQDYVSDQYEQPIFENPNLEATGNNFSEVDVTGPTVIESNESDGTLHDYQNSPGGYVPQLSIARPQFTPVRSEVSQDITVHILNTGEKRPNVTFTKLEDSSPALHSNASMVSEKNSSSTFQPNVHMSFTMQVDKGEEGNPEYVRVPVQKVPEVTYESTDGCPTIKIDSYTKISNTLQSKEGCTDLNIILNSHVLNTNNFKSPATSGDNYELATGERYPGGDEGYDPIGGNFNTPSGSYFTSATGVGAQEYPVNQGQIAETIPGEVEPSPLLPGTSIFEVFQQTQINVGSQNDANAPESEIFYDPTGAGVADVPGGGSLGSPSLDALQGPLADAGPESVAADTPVSGAADGSSGLQLPGGINPLSGINNQLSDAIGNLGSQDGNGGSDGLLGSGGSDDDDDDDDDMMDFMPFSLMESVTSMLPFFTLINPLNYGFLSIAISPFAIAAAGLFGLAAVLAPWALPSVFNFGRAAHRVTIKVRPNLEEVVRQSIHSYTNWNEWKSKRKKRKRVRVSNTAHDKKNLPDIKLSMRTVATQLLNVSDPNEASKSMADSQKDSSETKKLVTVAKIEKVDKSADGAEKSKIQDKDLLIKEINSEITSLESIGVSFGRPTNSKFGYFETSHPGQAMAVTDEELEREMSSKRDGSLYKNQATTSGGISTWILLNSPTTTPTPTQKETKEHEMTNKFTTKPTASIQRVEIKQKVDQKPTAVVEKVIPNPHSTVKVMTSSQGKPLVKKTPNPILIRHTLTPETVQTHPTTPKTSVTTVEANNSPVTEKASMTTAKKIVETQKPMSQRVPVSFYPNPILIRHTLTPQTVQTHPTTPKTSVTTVEANNSPVTEKASMTTAKKIVETQKPMSQRVPVSLTTTQKPSTKTVKPNTNRGKFPARTTTTTAKPVPTKQEIVTTPKVEGVTFKPIQMIPTPKDESKPEEPLLQTKPKTSIPMGTPKISPALQTKTTTPQPKETTAIVKTDFTGSDLVEVPMQIKPSMTKVNNVLKVQLKKPVEESIRVSADSTKSNAAIVQKTEKPVAEEAIDYSSESGVSQAVNNSQFEVEFDFNPELTKIQLETSTKEPEVLTTTTTKKPRRNSQKRRKNKNKNRKRKQPVATTESNEIPVISESNATEIAAQESKVEPETKESTPVIKTNNKKKEVQKPIGTQIYNFLSREIMPSFGVVSLVGLGLGIASYFLYPFGGGIARRNYQVEPNYKYNLGEYGGNYGQSEEEVISKVIQGMTNHEDKYGVGSMDYDLQNNYHRYQKFGSPIITDAKLSKKSDQRYSPSTLASEPTYDKPFENSYELKYRNTEFKYPEVSTTTNYFERQKQSAYMVSNEGDVDRQFVVGNVPKEYGYDETPIIGKKTQTYGDSGEIIKTQFEQDQNQKFQKHPANEPVLPTYGQPETLSLKSDVNYDDIEITPTAVAVEHGPRALKVKRSIDEKLFRFYPTRYRRESVIQVIPHSGSQEVEEKEEDLSNEIFGILDSMIPDKDENRKVKDKKVSNAIDNEEMINKKHGEANPQLHEITTAQITAKIVESTVKPIETSPTTTTEFEKIEITSITSAAPTEEPTTSPQSKDISTDDTIQTEGQEVEETTAESNDSTTTTEKTEKEAEQGFNLFNFVKKVAEIKFRLGLTILKHASEGFARYLGGVQKRINGEE